jgi:hypothetical protein
MDWLTFISKLVEALAWPSVVVGVLLFLRNELPSIVRSLRKLKFKDVEMEFGEAAKALAAETKRAMPVTDQDFPVMGLSYNAVLSRLSDLADLSPRAAILEAWLLVEASAAEYLRKHHSAPRTPFPGPLRLLEGLRQAEVLTPPQEAAFEHLRRLRNDAVHTPDAEFTTIAVANYVESALAMAAYLEDMSQVELPTPEANP